MSKFCNLAYNAQNCWKAKDYPEIVALLAKNRQIELLSAENPLILRAIENKKAYIKRIDLSIQP